MCEAAIREVLPCVSMDFTFAPATIKIMNMKVSSFQFHAANCSALLPLLVRLIGRTIAALDQQLHHVRVTSDCGILS